MLIAELLLSGGPAAPFYRGPLGTKSRVTVEAAVVGAHRCATCTATIYRYAVYSAESLRTYCGCASLYRDSLICPYAVRSPCGLSACTVVV